MNIPFRLMTVAFVLSLAGCAGMPWEQARPDARLSTADRVAELQRKSAADPDAIEVAAALGLERQQYVREELKNAEHAASLGSNQVAFESLQHVLLVDPGNYKARQAQQVLARQADVEVDIARARKLGVQRPQQALNILSQVLAEQPNQTQALRLRNELLRTAQRKQSNVAGSSKGMQKQVSLNFKNQPIKTILDVISRASGVNFVFDRDVDINTPTSFFAEKMPVENAISLLLQANQLEKKMQDGTTFLLYPNTPAKKKEYETFVIRTFFLSHADAKSVVTALRQLVKPKDVYVDERVNAVVVRDKPEAILVAERLIMGLDLPQSEVTLDVQVLEVNIDDKLDLGVQYPEKVRFDALAGAESGKLTLGELLKMNRDRVTVSSETSTLGLAIEMLQKRGKTKTLANPKIRVRNMEKASIKIGERVPIVTTTNANGVVSESVNFQDVGLLLQVEPRISLNDEVSVKVSMEVSSILSKQTTKTGLVAYTLGTRNAQTLMTAKNSETQILAGLIKRSESEMTSGLPGLSRVPGLGRLFGSNGNSEERSEVVLLITPHIERNLELPVAAVSMFNSGTESNTAMSGNAAVYGDDVLDMDAPLPPPGKGMAQDGAGADQMNGERRGVGAMRGVS